MVRVLENIALRPLYNHGSSCWIQKTSQNLQQRSIQNQNLYEQKSQMSVKNTRIILGYLCTLRRVDFPQPLGPRSIQNCPKGMLSEQSLRMGTILPCLVDTQKLKLRPSMATFSAAQLLHTKNRKRRQNQNNPSERKQKQTRKQQ